MPRISVDIDLDDIVEEMSHRDIMFLIKKYLKQNKVDDTERKELSLLLNIGFKEPIYTNNVINDLKLKDILPNLDNKSMEEIQAFFCA